jgi:ubiquinone/menaquinone biosynthesis C-methylase UbiE
MQKSKRDTSWQGVAGWYNKSVGSSGHYFHEKVILPGSLELLDLKPGAKLLDLACGQGVLAHHIPRDVKYAGVDLATDLIKYAKSQTKRSDTQFVEGDITHPLPIADHDFTHATVILALQNVEDFNAVFKNAAKHLVSGGKFLIVLNHPHFRIPRQTAWGIDEQTKQQYRKVYKYMSEMQIPIDMTPGKTKQKLTWSFHNPLENYIEALSARGFVVTRIKEWCSDKTSVGKAAKMENRSREEIPLFMAILAEKL